MERSKLQITIQKILNGGTERGGERAENVDAQWIQTLHARRKVSK